MSDPTKNTEARPWIVIGSLLFIAFAILMAVLEQFNMTSDSNPTDLKKEKSQAPPIVIHNSNTNEASNFAKFFAAGISRRASNNKMSASGTSIRTLASAGTIFT
jgi:hypothetical protein